MSFKCIKCNKEYKTKAGLTKHVNNFCSESKKENNLNGYIHDLRNILIARTKNCDYNRE